ncbi:MAG: hydrogenase small subunit [Bilophila sp.]
MELSRRDFVRLCTGTVAGFGVSQLFHPFVREVLAETLTGHRPPVFWVEGQGCTGCTVSLLNATHPGIADVLLKIIGMQYHPTLMAAEGQLAFQYMLNRANTFAGQYIFIVEGSIPLRADGRYCVVAASEHHEYTMVEVTDIMARNAAVVIAAGTCSAYGGVPAAHGQQTGAVSVSTFLQARNIPTPVINVPGCPPHPDWMVGTLVLLLDAIKRKGLQGGLVETLSTLDSVGRPKVFYPNTHLSCPWLGAYQAEQFSPFLTDKAGCRFKLGCKGPWSGCDAAKRKWNGGVNWCIANATCIGCTEPNFPDGKSPFYAHASSLTAQRSSYD